MGGGGRGRHHNHVGGGHRGGSGVHINIKKNYGGKVMYGRCVTFFWNSILTKLASLFLVHTLYVKKRSLYLFTSHINPTPYCVQIRHTCWLQNAIDVREVHTTSSDSRHTLEVFHHWISNKTRLILCSLTTCNISDLQLYELYSSLGSATSILNMLDLFTACMLIQNDEDFRMHAGCSWWAHKSFSEATQTLPHIRACGIRIASESIYCGIQCWFEITAIDMPECPQWRPT